MENIVILDANVLRGGFRNFEGRATDFKPAGTRTFVVSLEEDQAKELYDLGWNVVTKELPDGSVDYRLTIGVRFDRFPPDIRMYVNGNCTHLTEDNVKILDSATFTKVGLVIRPYIWKMSSGKTGVKAMLAEGRFQIKPSVLDDYSSDWENDISDDDTMPFDE